MVKPRIAFNISIKMESYPKEIICALREILSRIAGTCENCSCATLMWATDLLEDLDHGICCNTTYFLILKVWRIRRSWRLDGKFFHMLCTLSICHFQAPYLQYSLSGHPFSDIKGIGKFFEENNGINISIVLCD